MIRRFSSGSVDAGQAGEEPLPGVDHHEVHAQVRLEGDPQQLGLLLAHQPVVDVDARQPVAHGPMDERRRDGRVDAARQRADDLAVGAGRPAWRVDALPDLALTVDSMKFAGVQLGAIPAMPVTKLRRTSRPRGVCTTSGWNWMPYRFRAGAARPAYGVESVCAVAWKPSGSRVIESPWLIQTGCSRSMPPNSPSSRVIWTVAGPYSRLVGRE